MRKQKFNLDERISALNLDPRLGALLEHTRPLTDNSLRKLNQNIETVASLVAFAKDASAADLGFRFAVGLEAATDLPLTTWAKAIIKGAAYGVYAGRFSQQDAYAALCLAAGSCLRAPEAEAFRIALSLVTRAGLRPPEGDDSGRIHIEVSDLPLKWVCRADTYGSLVEVKGAIVVECLALGLGCLTLEGLTKREAERIFKETYPWRASSPIPQLLSQE